MPGNPMSRGPQLDSHPHPRTTELCHLSHLQLFGGFGYQCARLALLYQWDMTGQGEALLRKQQGAIKAAEQKRVCPKQGPPGQLWGQAWESLERRGKGRGGTY